MISIISPSIANLSLLPISFNDAKVAFDRFFDTVDLPGESQDGSECPAIRSITISNLSYAYIGRKAIINNLSASFCVGKINCIIGKSGSGKSTFCKLLDKSYHTADDSSLLINNEIPLNSIRLSDYRRHVGVVPQDILMTEGTVLQNICAGLDGAMQDVLSRAVGVFQSHGLIPYLMALPNGLNTVVGEAGVSLSGGELQLVAFSRLLVHNPDVFILDEPTSAMDPQLRDHIWNLLCTLCNSHLVIVVTHQDAMLQKFSDHVNYITLQ